MNRSGKTAATSGSERFINLPTGRNVWKAGESPQLPINYIMITEEKESRTFSIRVLSGAKPLEQLI